MDNEDELNTTLIYDETNAMSGNAPNLSFTNGPTLPNAGIHSHCAIKISFVEFALLGGAHNNISRANFDLYNFDDLTWTVMPGEYC